MDNLNLLTPIVFCLIFGVITAAVGHDRSQKGR
jgi:hypothetical protein